MRALHQSYHQRAQWCKKHLSVMSWGRKPQLWRLRTCHPPQRLVPLLPLLPLPIPLPRLASRRQFLLLHRTRAQKSPIVNADVWNLDKTQAMLSTSLHSPIEVSSLIFLSLFHLSRFSWFLFVKFHFVLNFLW